MDLVGHWLGIYAEIDLNKKQFTDKEVKDVRFVSTMTSFIDWSQSNGM